MSASDKSSADGNAFGGFGGFGKFVPGFDFLQNLATQAAGSAAERIPQMPNLGSWVAPTLNVEELDKRIGELKSVQFWLDQNALALKATIQALEVQKMTLATLKGMNFNMGDVANAFKLKVADTLAGGVQGAADKAKTFAGLEVPPRTVPKDTTENESPAFTTAASPSEAPSASAPAAAAPAGIVDPMQWWGALTQQFQTIAADAMKDAAKKTAIHTAKSTTAGMAKGAMKTAGGLARGMTDKASKAVASGTKAALGTALRSSQAWPIPMGAVTQKTSGTAKAPDRQAPAKPAVRVKAASKPAHKAARKSAR